MTDLQLYLAIGVPSFVALMGILVNGLLYHMPAATVALRTPEQITVGTGGLRQPD